MNIFRCFILILGYLTGCTAQQTDSRKTKTLETELHRAIDLSDTGKWDDAVKILNRLSDQNPEELQVRFERAIVYLNLDNTKPALKDLEFVYKRNPHYPGVQNWLAITKSDLGLYAEAGELKFSELKSYDPSHWGANGQAWANCAGYFLKASNPERALEVLAVYFKNYEGMQEGYEKYMPSPYNAKARALLALERPDEALQATDKAIALPGSTPADLFLRVQALAYLGETEMAQTELITLKTIYDGTAPYNEVAEIFKSLSIPLP